MTEWVMDIVQRMGYLGILFLMFLENLFPPIPSELIMPFAGMVSARHPALSFVGVVVAGTAGAVVGALVLYYLGAKLGPDRLRDWADHHGHWLGFDGEDLDRARGWFDRHGGATVLFCRLIPGVRSVISIPAGVDRMPLPQFLLFTTVGSAVWTALLAGAGRLLGANYDRVEKFLDPVTWVVLGAIVVLWLVRVVKKQRQGGSRQRSTA